MPDNSENFDNDEVDDGDDELTSDYAWLSPDSDEESRRSQIVPCTLTLTMPDIDTPDSSMRIEWCVDAAFEKFMIDHIIKAKAGGGHANAHIVISVMRGVWSENPAENMNNREVKRFVFPLTQKRGYVTFSRSGPHYLMAIVVWNTTSSVNDVHYKLSRTDDFGKCTSRIIGMDNDFMLGIEAGNISLDRSQRSNVIPFVVPAGSFAKVPAQWRKDLLSKFFGKGRGYDFCSFEKWFWGLGFFQVLTLSLIVSMAVRIIVTAFRLFLGFSGTDYKQVLHPLSGRLDPLLARTHYCFWFFKAPKKENHWDRVGEARSPFLWPFNPPTLLALFIFGKFFFRHVGVAWVLLLVLVIVAIFGGLFMVGVAIGKAHARREANRPSRPTPAPKKAKVKTVSKEELAALQQLVCAPDAAAVPFDPSVIGWRSRLRLWLGDIKSGHCRPFEVDGS